MQCKETRAAIQTSMSLHRSSSLLISQQDSSEVSVRDLAQVWYRNDGSFAPRQTLLGGGRGGWVEKLWVIMGGSTMCVAGGGVIHCGVFC